MPRTRFAHRSILASCTTLIAATTLASPAIAGDCVADLDGDGRVGGGDLGQLLAGWSGPGATDLDGDGTTGGSDLGIMLADWGCEVSEPPTTLPLRLLASETILETGVPTEIVFDVPVPALIRETAASIALFEVDATGTPIGEALATLEDDPYDDPWDSIYVDGVYTTSVVFDEPVDRTFEIAAVADLGGGATQGSSAILFKAVTPPSEGAILAHLEVLERSHGIWIESRDSLGDTTAAREAAREQILLEPGVAEVTYSTSLIVIELESGLESVVVIDPDDAGRRVPRGQANPVPPLRVSHAVTATSYSMNRFRVQGDSQCLDCGRLKNNRVLYWDAESDHPDYSSWWSNACSDFDVTHLLGEECTIESLRAMPDYGTILLSAHGGAIVNEAGEWRCVLTTGTILDSSNLPTYFPRYIAAGLGVATSVQRSSGTVTLFGIRPDVIRTIGGLEESVVFLAACETSKPPADPGVESLPRACLDAGSCAVLGMTEVTYGGFLLGRLEQFFSEMSSGVSVEKSFGLIAGATDVTGARVDLRLRNPDAGRLAYDDSNALREGGFEFCGGGSEAWLTNQSSPSGVYQLFLDNTPTEGEYLAALIAGEAHGEAYPTSTLRQSFPCPAGNIDRLVFDWKMVWSAYDIWDPPIECNPEGAVVSVTLSDGQGTVVEVFGASAGTECGNFVDEASSSDGFIRIVGTPWAREEIDVSAFFASLDSESGAVTIEFKITEIYGASSAFLIDAVEFIDDTP